MALSGALNYISTITHDSRKPMFATPRKTPFFVFLAGITTVQCMYNKLVPAEHPKLKYIDLSHTRWAPMSNAHENEDVWDTACLAAWTTLAVGAVLWPVYAR